MAPGTNGRGGARSGASAGGLALLFVGLFLLLGGAYSPVLATPFRASDHRALAEAAWPASAEPSDEERAAPPLASAALRASWALAERVERAGVLGAEAAVRLEALLLLLAAAFGLAWFTRRLLLPWTGSVHAAAAGWAAGLLFALHPLAGAAVVRTSAIGELLAVALGVGSSVFFLIGRQDRRIGFTVTSFVLCSFAGFASNLTLGLPILFAGAEFLSAHRYRTVRGRLRTTLTTLVVFGIAASLELMLHVRRLGFDALPSPLRALSAADGAGGVALELERILAAVGLLVLPVNEAVWGAAGALIAGGLFLTGAQPALVAARSAPRLWTALFLFFLLGLAATLVLHAGVDPSQAALAGTSPLLSAAAVMAVGGGIACTAMSGARRRALPFVLAVGYAVLAHGNALAWRAAGEDARALGRDLDAAVAAEGVDATYLVLDPPPPSAGVDPLDADPRWLVDARAFDGRRPRVVALDGRAFGTLVRQPEAAASGGWVVLEPRIDGARRFERFQAGEPASGPRSWQNELVSPPLDLDPCTAVALAVRPSPGADPSTLEEVRWTSAAGETRSARAGASVEDREGRLLLYDLSALPAWTTCGRVRSVRFESGRLPLLRVEVRGELPRAGEGARLIRGQSAWRFLVPELGFTPDAGAETHWVLTLLSPTRLTSVELDPEADADAGVVFPGAAEAARRLADGGALVWTLELRVAPSERALVREEGRLQAGHAADASD